MWWTCFWNCLNIRKPNAVPAGRKSRAAEQATALLQKPLTIKKDLDNPKALEYLEKFTEAGLLVKIEAYEVAPAQQAKAGPNPTDDVFALLDATFAQSIKPTTLTRDYQKSFAVALATSLVSPLIYVGLIVLSVWALVWYFTSGHGLLFGGIEWHGKFLLFLGISSWVVKTLGKKITMIFPDYAFGYDHRDFLGRAVPALGGTIQARLAIPPTETSFSKYFARVPADTEVLYHVMVGPGVLTFVKEMGEHFGARRPQIFGFIDSLEGVDLASPGLEYLEGTHFWEAFPRYAGGYPTPHERFYRDRVGVNDAGASLRDPKDVSTYSPMFGCWETLFVIKQAVEQSGYRDPTPKDYRALIETLEEVQWFNEGIQHPQGPKKFVGQIHQSFGQQFISKVEKGRLKVVHRTKIEDSLYPPEADYRKQPL